MRYTNFLWAVAICLVFCSKNENIKPDTKQMAEYKVAEENHQSHHKQYVNLLGIDSIAVFDKSIEKIAIDSINFLPMSFDAKYITCFKVNLIRDLYLKLKSIDTLKYEQIMAITTDHKIVRGDSTYYFHGMQNVNCYPESSEVRIESILYSLYSAHRFLGRILIIEDITQRPDIRRQEEDNGG